MRLALVSMLVIFAVWVVVLFWSARELQHVLEMTP